MIVEHCRTDAKKSIAIKSSWKYELNKAKSENIYLFHCLFYRAISFTVTMRSSNWNWYGNLFDWNCLPPPSHFSEVKEGKNRMNFLQFSKHKTANERGICAFSKKNRSIVFQSSKLNKSMFVCVLFIWVAFGNLFKMSWHWKRIAAFYSTR